MKGEGKDGLIDASWSGWARRSVCRAASSAGTTGDRWIWKSGRTRPVPQRSRSTPARPTVQAQRSANLSFCRTGKVRTTYLADIAAYRCMRRATTASCEIVDAQDLDCRPLQNSTPRRMRNGTWMSRLKPDIAWRAYKMLGNRQAPFAPTAPAPTERLREGGALRARTRLRRQQGPRNAVAQPAQWPNR